MKGEKIMAKTYAAFYLPPEEKEVKLPDQKNVCSILSSTGRKGSKITGSKECR